MFLFAQNAFSAGPSGKDGFDAGQMILHHIYDSHEWHVFDWKGKSYSIPLPIIIFHEEKGLDIFMSSKFDHGKSIHNNYMLDHGKIVFIGEDGQIDNLQTGMIWDFSITKNVFSLLFSIFILLSVFITISRRYKNQKNTPPKGIQSLLEPIIIFVRDDIAKSAIGEKHTIPMIGNRSKKQNSKIDFEIMMTNL